MPTPVSRFGQIASDIESFLASHQLVTIVCFTLLYIPDVCARALMKPLWFDELFTLTIARLPSMPVVFQALKSGVEPNPPLLYLLTHWSITFGLDELVGARIPSIVGFWLMSVCLYICTARRGPRLLALLTMFTPAMTGLLYYATEARPYGLLTGLSALALVLWQHDSDGPWNFLTPVLLFFTLLAAILTHYYAVLLPIVFALGEASRSLRKRQLNWIMVSAILLPYLSLLTLRPMLAAQTANQGTHWASPVFQSVVDFYTLALGPLLLPFIFIALAVSVYEAITGAMSRTWPNPPYEELVISLAFLMIPLFSYVLAISFTHTYTGRYSIASVVGMALCLWWLCFTFFRRGTESALVAVMIVVAFFGLDELRVIRRSVNSRVGPQTRDIFPFPFDGDLPVVVQDPRDFLQMVHYASPLLVRRLYYLADARQSLKYSGSSDLDLALIGLRSWRPLKVEQFERFVLTHERFLLFWGKPEEAALVGWQMSRLRALGANLQLVEQNNQRLLFEVTIVNR